MIKQKKNQEDDCKVTRNNGRTMGPYNFQSYSLAMSRSTRLISNLVDVNKNGLHEFAGFQNNSMVDCLSSRMGNSDCA